ncbi:TonB-dependent receptor [Chitinophaga sancti]|uniref:Outer membrane receptor proteins, mostly Fe transport n=1 Tax=Chitinophaga sancti TaxID=1004 RepID=A0A1K1RX06_9BACT|nr:TonB-dependent receptor [Chitinophaga sancti]WQD64024.1 TonB-dependent receptor [Chitinophaga sancti]WQG90352.1 TonB-dependent receptor [Chitinophaga sancti]SFW76582.1 Outer membrane receptor proteins, mostly Fe transport [Chitinophaga sancti]
MNFFKLLLVITMSIVVTKSIFAQQQILSGKVIDSTTHIPSGGVTVRLTPGNLTDITDENGRFSFKKIPAEAKFITISAVGYQQQSFPLSEFKHGQVINMASRQTQLTDVVITANTGNPYKALSEMDIRMRGVSNSQEVLRIVPGLFIGQHQGGGKAEQIFLRGFDNDHGTDINMSVDGLPINMVSHAHGQGYADSHFIIPETIESTTYQKGMYNAEKGDLAVTGFVNFNTVDAISSNMVKLEGGQYNTYRALAMINLLEKKAGAHNRSWYAASEYRYSDSYFDHAQHFKRFNFFTKYHDQLNEHNWLTLTASSLYSKWDASGQIPEGAVEEGKVGFFGQLDPNEGGVTARTNVNIQLRTTLPNHDIIKNQVYYSRYKFDLFTNFTFFLEDTVNGDEIRQKEARNLFGYNGSYLHESYVGNAKLISEAGINARFDATENSSLSHTINRYTIVAPFKLGDITEFSAGGYVNETLQLNDRFSLNAGLRFDQFYYKYNNKLEEDSTLKGAGVYKANNNVFSPKLNFYYQATEKAQLYLLLGKGFHSNDARVVVVEKGGKTLPAAYGADLGTVLKLSRTLLLNAALWYSYLQKEFVYAGDGGTVEFSGRTRRVGFDFSGRFQPLAALYVDADVNYAHGRSIDDPKGGNYIPLAPVWSSTGGITWQLKNGINGSFRYRYLGDRPANEDYSLTAKGYFVNDLVLNYTKAKFEVGLTINNVFNVRWKETQFETVTRLRGEQPLNGVAFTPGTKFAALAHVSYFFR